MADIPSFTIDARDLHAPALLKALAAKVRGTDPTRADIIDKLAEGFAAWKRRNPNVR